jgi:hypothetical protein
VEGQSLRPAAFAQPGTQIPLGPLQMMPEVALPHSLSPSVLEQPQIPCAVRHSGLLPLQSAPLVPLHSVQAPLSPPEVWQAGAAGFVQLESSVQATHEWPGLHTGVVPEQSALVRHATQRFGVVPDPG